LTNLVLFSSIHGPPAPHPGSPSCPVCPLLAYSQLFVANLFSFVRSVPTRSIWCIFLSTRASVFALLLGLVNFVCMGCWQAL
uniref:Uncharacterized protein n=2 Tax=Aegilops tauschii subsp. strangulata TaxID=200361 RepID=A0A453I2A1_AEGTS